MCVIEKISIIEYFQATPLHARHCTLIFTSVLVKRFNNITIHINIFIININFI